MPRRFAWTAELETLAKELFRDGHTVEVIADRVGASRNCIFQAIRRRHWKRGQAALIAKRGAKVWTKTPRNTEVAKARDRQMAAELQTLAYAFPEAVPGAGKPIHKMGLVGEECRWPVGTLGDVAQAFCGAAVKSGAYCTVHHALAYRPATRVDKQAEHELRRVSSRGETGVKVG